MKSILSLLMVLFFFNSYSFAQSENSYSRFSLLLLNGTSNHIFFGDSNFEEKNAYVNAIGFHYSFKQFKNRELIIGLQYEKNGYSTDWVCDANWDYCSTIGAAPISVKSISRLHYFSLLLNYKFSLGKKFYMRTGWGLDVPFNASSSSKYTDAYNKKSRDINWNRYGNKVPFNTTMGANLTIGKTFPINEKWGWLIETHFKMYNIISIRFEDYEDYFFAKNEKPYVFGINLGIFLY